MANQLPPGQQESSDFPRFGLTRFASRFPTVTGRVEISIVGEVKSPLAIGAALQHLPRIDQASDFHCVTTWSRCGVRWSGVRFRDLYERVIKQECTPDPDATFVILRGQDGARASLPLQDLLAEDVLLADTLDGKPLSIEHGAPIRIVAPAHYGYKSIKHLCKIEFARDDTRYRPSGFRFMEHPRARVAFEERGIGFPGWLLRRLYRPLIAPTSRRFARAMNALHEKR